MFRPRRGIARSAFAALVIAAVPLAIIRRQAKGRLEPRSVEVDARGGATLGLASAPVTMVYYTDYRCAECRLFANETLPELRRRFVDTGRLRIVSREVAWSEESAILAGAARCAGEFGKYWQFHDSLFATSERRLTTDVLNRIARRIGLPRDPFVRCITSRRYTRTIRAGSDRIALGSITRVPAAVIGITPASSPSTVRGSLVLGSLRLTILDSLIHGGAHR